MFFSIPFFIWFCMVIFFIWFCMVIFLIECWFYYSDNQTFFKYTFDDILLSLFAVIFSLFSYQVDYEKQELKNEAQIIQSKITILELKK